MSEELRPGVVVAGRYRLDHLLGRGGMGQVWAVTHEVTHRAAALKLLNGPLHESESRRRRFLREARAASAVNHPNVVRVHDFFELVDGTPVMIMDLLEGETLGKRLRREGSLSIEAAAAILLPVVSAVGTAHARGVIHRDLKPENVFLSATPSGVPDVRVLDFGIAKLVDTSQPGADDSEALTQVGGFVGTPAYMSPEQGFGEGTADHRADIWSLGVVLYESLAGCRPVDGANVGQVLKRLLSEAITPIEVLVPDLPPQIAALVGRMLTRDLEGRPKDLREVAEVLAEYTTVVVPPFQAATGEAPVPLDSGPGSVRSQPRTVVRVEEPSDPIAATDPAARPLSTQPSLRVEASRTVAVTGRGRRGIVVAAVVLGAGLVTAFSLRAQRPAPVPASGATRAPATAALPPSAAVVEPSPSATVVAPTPSAAVEPVRRHPSARRAGSSKTQGSPAPSSGHVGGLVDRPPF